MKLVDNSEEQDRLEQLLEDSKPPYPEDCAGLHYLLFTPFRYRPHKQGSRFRREGQIEDVFYASESPYTALAEKGTTVSYSMPTLQTHRYPTTLFSTRSSRSNIKPTKRSI